MSDHRVSDARAGFEYGCAAAWPSENWNNLGTLAPEHKGKRGSRADQKTRRDNNLDNPALSAKPPSPVQIRAAPPKFISKNVDPADERAPQRICGPEKSLSIAYALSRSRELPARSAWHHWWMENDAPLTEQDGAGADPAAHRTNPRSRSSEPGQNVFTCICSITRSRKRAEGWRVGVKGLADEGLQVIGAGAGLLDAMRQGRVALREQQVAETKPRRRSKPTQRRAPS